MRCPLTLGYPHSEVLSISTSPSKWLKLLTNKPYFPPPPKNYSFFLITSGPVTMQCSRIHLSEAHVPLWSLIYWVGPHIPLYPLCNRNTIIFCLPSPQYNSPTYFCSNLLLTQFKPFFPCMALDANHYYRVVTGCLALNFS